MRAVIFDIDNTMYDYTSGDRAGTAALCRYAARFLDCPEERFRDLLARAKAIVCERVGSDTAAQHNRLIRMQVILELMGRPPFPHGQNLHRCYWEALLGTAKPEPGLTAAMEALKKAGLHLGVGTDMTADIQYQKLERLGVARWIDSVTTSEEVGAENPNARLFGQCIRKAGVPAGECLFLGDSLIKDVRGALAAGMQACLYAPGRGEKQEEGAGEHEAEGSGRTGDFSVLSSFYDLPGMIIKTDRENWGPSGQGHCGVF